MPVNTQSSDYQKYKPIWEKVRDVCSGQDTIKSKGEKYLSKIKSWETEKYDAYKQRAQFPGFTNRTLNVSLGNLFRKNPTGIDSLGDYADNIDLCGSNFIYWSRKLASEIMQTNYVGVIVDWSDSMSRPYAVTYKAEQIINVRETIHNGVELITMIMLEGETYVHNPQDPYATEEKKIWKELYLDPVLSGETIVSYVYKARDWQEVRSADGNISFQIVPGSEKTPQINGQTFDRIPFFFLTSTGLNDDPSPPMLLNMANVELGYYKNSADHENRLHWAGQPSIITRGWPADKTFPIGSSADFPIDGGAAYITAPAESAIRDEMDKKEQIMAALGSSILSGRGRYVASAQTSQITSESEHSTLMDLANSMSYCVSQVMTLFMQWAGSSEPVNIQYNTDFQSAEIPQGKLTELMAAVQSGMMSTETFFYNLQTYEVYPQGWTIEQEKAGIEAYGKTQAASRDSQITAGTESAYQGQT